MKFDIRAWLMFLGVIIVGASLCYGFRDAPFFEMLIQMEVLVIASGFGALLADTLELHERFERWRKKE